MGADGFTSSTSTTHRNRLEGDRFIIEGHHQKCEEMSESLQRRFIENGMPRGELEQFIQRKEETA